MHWHHQTMLLPPMPVFKQPSNSTGMGTERATFKALTARCAFDWERQARSSPG